MDTLNSSIQIQLTNILKKYNINYIYGFVKYFYNMFNYVKYIIEDIYIIDEILYNKDLLDELYYYCHRKDITIYVDLNHIKHIKNLYFQIMSLDYIIGGLYDQISFKYNDIIFSIKVKFAANIVCKYFDEFICNNTINHLFIGYNIKFIIKKYDNINMLTCYTNNIDTNKIVHSNISKLNLSYPYDNYKINFKFLEQMPNTTIKWGFPKWLIPQMINLKLAIVRMHFLSLKQANIKDCCNFKYVILLCDNYSMLLLSDIVKFIS